MCDEPVKTDEVPDVAPTERTAVHPLTGIDGPPSPEPKGPNVSNVPASAPIPLDVGGPSMSKLWAPPIMSERIERQMNLYLESRVGLVATALVEAGLDVPLAFRSPCIEVVKWLEAMNLTIDNGTKAQTVMTATLTALGAQNPPSAPESPLQRLRAVVLDYPGLSPESRQKLDSGSGIVDVVLSLLANHAP